MATRISHRSPGSGREQEYGRPARCPQVDADLACGRFKEVESPADEPDGMGPAHGVAQYAVQGHGNGRDGEDGEEGFHGMKKAGVRRVGILPAG